MTYRVGAALYLGFFISLIHPGISCAAGEKPTVQIDMSVLEDMKNSLPPSAQRGEVPETLYAPAPVLKQELKALEVNPSPAPPNVPAPAQEPEPRPDEVKRPALQAPAAGAVIPQMDMKPYKPSRPPRVSAEQVLDYPAASGIPTLPVYEQKVAQPPQGRARHMRPIYSYDAPPPVNPDGDKPVTGPIDLVPPLPAKKPEHVAQAAAVLEPLPAAVILVKTEVDPSPSAESETPMMKSGKPAMPAVKAASVDAEVVFEDRKITPERPVSEHVEGAKEKNQSDPAVTAVAVETETVTLEDGAMRVTLPFQKNVTELDAGLKAALDRDIVLILEKNETWRAQIQSFATPVDDGLSSDRRAALSRALSVRAYLLEKGVASTRVDVRALGAKPESDQGLPDRTDIYLLKPGASL